MVRRLQPKPDLPSVTVPFRGARIMPKNCLPRACRWHFMDQQIFPPIAAHLGGWETAHVELAIYGTDEAHHIARND